MNTTYKICTRCVMDTSATDIDFDHDGICSYCHEFDALQNNITKQSEGKLRHLIQKIKTEGHGKKYDCIVGVSGGIDSSYALYLAVKEGLRPLAVHMDNGWNSELAVNNIESLCNTLKVDLYTHVIKWEEYRTLMQCFFDANVLDIELLYDNAMLAVNFQQASQFGIKYILAGTNSSTEGMRMPPKWNWLKYDKKNIVSIGKIFNKTKLKFSSFPMIGTIDFIKYRKIKKIEWVSFLDYFDYKKDIAVEILKKEIGYKPYPYKHYESVFTRFYQGYILPNKFGIDKRKLHLATLVASKQILRSEALKSLSSHPYPQPEDLETDIDYFLKKMKWNRSQLEDYLSRPESPHDTYPSEKPFWNFAFNLSRKFR